MHLFSPGGTTVHDLPEADWHCLLPPAGPVGSKLSPSFTLVSGSAWQLPASIWQFPVLGL